MAWPATLAARKTGLSARTVLWVAAIACPLGLYLLHAAYFRAYLDDDAGISLTYARNLAEGFGPVLNPGGERVEGYSNPLWVALLAGVHLLGLDLPTAAKLLGIGLGGLALLVLAAVGRRLYGWTNPAYPALALGLTAASTSYAVWTGGGLENGLYVLLLLAATFLHLGELRQPRFPASALVLVGVALTRPEGTAYVLLFAAHRLAYRLYTRSWSRHDLHWLSGLVGAYAVYLTWHQSYFDTLLPNTHAAKDSHLGLSQILELAGPGWTYVRDFVAGYHLLLAAPLVLLALAPWRYRAHARETPLARSTPPPATHRQALSPGAAALERALPALLAATTLLAAVYMGGDWMFEFRFLTPAIPFVYLLSAAGLAELVRLGRGRGRVPSLPVAALTTMLAILLFVALGSPALIRSPQALAEPTVPFWRVAGRGHFFAAQAELAGLGPAASYADPDLGGTSFYSGLEMIDLGGLADATISRYKYAPATLRAYIFEERKPTFVHLHGVWFRRTGLDDTPEMDRDYLIFRRYYDSEGLNADYVRKDVLVVPGQSEGQPRDLGLGHGIRYQGDDLASTLSTPGGKIGLTVFWRAAARPDSDFATRWSLRQPDGREIARYDQPIAYGWYPTSRWAAGEIIREQVRLLVPASAPAGEATLTVALVDPATHRVVGPTQEVARLTIDAAAGTRQAAQSFERYLALHTTDWPAARRALERAQLLSPADPTYRPSEADLAGQQARWWLRQARVAELAGRLEQAIDDLGSARRLSPQEPGLDPLAGRLSAAAVARADADLAAGDRDGARAWLARALTATPADPRLRHRLEDLRPGE